MRTVEIDAGSGFCFGVTAAIKKAEEELAKGTPLYCLGDIVHNSDEVERLRLNGLVTISHEQMAGLHDCKVLLRAHGEPPETYELARRNNIEIIDATCPVVLKLQQRIKKAYDSTDAPQIVIYGKLGHAEVNGLVGQTSGNAKVVETEADLAKVDPNRTTHLYSQTTKSLNGLRDIAAKLGEHLSDNVEFHTFDTICRSVAHRVDNLREFARSHDAIIFVAGRKSSNGKFLFDECRAVNPRTQFISGPDELDLSLLEGAESIGICGATSTPRWLMERVKEKIL
ncbi:MAG: 4-hydroxy-3-methylbut-2-enyl diphosphate reductase [Muribaculaceae bacterium]|nr:4-hydroxy-3-methylbut-2-enyl diphosphate reductase [Bacteroides sp.]MDE6262059.1 4-hydroxy-3-methylbut-2-enyl diphosphate reductase [Muribaculaceae bacterium]